MLSWRIPSDCIYEIDEFDCSSIFVIVGKERALVIDTGIGIRGLRSVVESIVDGKPYLVVLSHVHPDHIGGAFNYDSLYLHENDFDPEAIMNCAAVSTRRDYANMIQRREQKPYPYDCTTDITEWCKTPDFKLVQGDCTEFDLGERCIKVFACPGHTSGSILFWDESTGYLIVGDACNGCYLLNSKGYTCLSDAAGAACLALQK